MSKYKLDREKILNRLTTLSITALTIQKTAKYLLQFYKSADSIVVLWYQSICASSSDQTKVALFYLANEVLQSKNHGAGNFRHTWKAQIVQAVEHIKDEPYIDKIKRIFNIWIERKVFDVSFVEDLIRRLSTVSSPKANEETTQAIIQNFDADEAIEKLSDLIKVETDVAETMKSVDVSSLTFDELSTNASIKKLKNKQKCQEFSDKLDTNISQLFKVCSMLEEELKVRQSTHKLMENAEIFYETQFTETLIVEDAYRRYGTLITKTRQALEKHVDYLMDDDIPIDVEDAPSPGKTPPHLYQTTHTKEETNEKPETQKCSSPVLRDPFKNNESVLAQSSPTQSMDMSDENNDDEMNDKPYSPTQQTQETSIKNLSNSDAAMKLLTSVFNKSFTHKSENSSSSVIPQKDDKSRSNSNTGYGNMESTNTNSSFNLQSNNNSLSVQNPGTSIPTLLSNANASTNFSMLQHHHQQQQQQQNIFMPSTNSPGNIMNPLLAGLNPPQNYLSLLANYQQHQAQAPPPPPPSLPPPRPPQPLQYNPEHMTGSPGSCTPEEDEDEDDQMGGDTPTQDEPVQIAVAPTQQCSMFQQAPGTVSATQASQQSTGSMDPATALLAGLNTTPEELTKKIQDVISNPYAFSKIAAAASAASNLQVGSQPPSQMGGMASIPPPPPPPASTGADQHASQWGITNPFPFPFRFQGIGNASQPPNNQNFTALSINNQNINHNANMNNIHNNSFQHPPKYAASNNGPSHNLSGYHRPPPPQQHHHHQQQHHQQYKPQVMMSHRGNKGFGGGGVDLDDEDDNVDDREDGYQGNSDARMDPSMEIDDEGDNKYTNNFILDDDEDGEDGNKESGGNPDVNKKPDVTTDQFEDKSAVIGEQNESSVDNNNSTVVSSEATESTEDDEVHYLYADVEEQLDKSLASYRQNPRGRGRYPNFHGNRPVGRIPPDRYHLYKGGEGARFPGGGAGPFHHPPRPPPFHYHPRGPHFSPHRPPPRFRHPPAPNRFRY